MLKPTLILQSISKTSEAGKFALIAAICGGSTGFARFFISEISEHKVRHQDPEHYDLIPSIFLGTPSFIAGAFLAFVIVKIVIGENNLSRNIFIWIFVGLIYGIFVPFITGLLLPMGEFFMVLTQGLIAWEKAFFYFLDAIVLAPTSAFTHGIFGVISGLIGGGCLAATFYGIDRLQTAGFKWQFAAGITFSILMMIFSKLSPAPFLVNFA